MFFNEKQSIKSIWFKIAFIVFNLGLIVFMLWSYFSSNPKDGNTELLIAILIVTIVEIGVYYLVFLTKAITRVDNSGIHISYKPFLLKTKSYKWNEIQKIEYHNINPITDFGGWGYRISTRNGKGIILGNGDAMRLIDKKGKKITITTSKKNELKSAIEKWDNSIS